MQGFNHLWCDRIKKFVQGEVWEFELMMTLATISKLKKN
jgi:hypothetical protein